MHAFYSRQSAANNGDVSTNGCYLAAGTYTLYLYGYTASTCGKVDVSLDGFIIAAGVDWYSAAITKNVIKSTATVVVNYSGWHVVKLTTNGQNGASSGFAIPLTYIEFRPAAD